MTIFNVLDKPFVNQPDAAPLEIPRSHPHQLHKERLNLNVLSQLHRIFAFAFGLLTNMHNYNEKLVEKIYIFNVPLIIYEDGSHWAIFQIWRLDGQFAYIEDGGVIEHLYSFRVMKTSMPDKDRMSRWHKILEGPIKWF